MSTYFPTVFGENLMDEMCIRDSSRGARVVVANLPQTRAAFMRVRLRGRGGCTLESLARGVQSGTELLPWRRS